MHGTSTTSSCTVVIHYLHNGVDVEDQQLVTYVMNQIMLLKLHTEAEPCSRNESFLHYVNEDLCLSG